MKIFFQSMDIRSEYKINIHSEHVPDMIRIFSQMQQQISIRDTAQSFDSNLDKWLNARFQIKWLWIRIPLQSLKNKIVNIK